MLTFQMSQHGSKYLSLGVWRLLSRSRLFLSWFNLHDRFSFTYITKCRLSCEFMYNIQWLSCTCLYLSILLTYADNPHIIPLLPLIISSSSPPIPPPPIFPILPYPGPLNTISSSSYSPAPSVRRANLSLCSLSRCRTDAMVGGVKASIMSLRLIWTPRHVDRKQYTIARKLDISSFLEGLAYLKNTQNIANVNKPWSIMVYVCMMGRAE